MLGNDYLDVTFKVCICLYIPVIFTVKYFVDNFLCKQTKKHLCDALELPWASWCFLLSGFSGFGIFYTGKYLLEDYQSIRVTESYASFWYYAFIISKLPELIDTLFIVLRSKPLVALQWYHHFATLLICYSTSHLACDEFTLFFFMNYFVHFFMYAYFGFYCFFNKSTYSFYSNLLKVFGTFVNVIQTVQMFIAIGLSFYLYNSDRPMTCNYIIGPEEYSYLCTFAVCMYLSYFILFVMLFFDRQKRISNTDKKKL